MTRLRCLDCLDGWHCHHTGYVSAGTYLANSPTPTMVVGSAKSMPS
jgi:hypothetical protein